MKIKSFKYFYPEKPVLIHRDQDLVDQLSVDDSYVAEPKYNGQRTMLHIIDGEVEFWSRHGEKLAYNKNPDAEMVAELKRLFPKGYFLFDGELRHNKVVGARHKIVFWDVYIWNHEFLYKTPYWSRRRLLAEVFEVDETLKVSLIRQYYTDFKKVFAELTAEENEYEGLVIKNKLGKMKPGRKTGSNSLWMYKIRKQTGRHRF